MELGKLDEAANEFQEALRLDPAAWGDLSSWGTLLARQGRMQEAIGKWEAAMKLNPAVSDPYIEWGNALYSQGHYAEALQKHRAALALNPNLHGNVARDLMELGKLDEAANEFQEALRLNPA